MKRTTKIVSAGALVMALMLVISNLPSEAAPLVSPLPCPPDVTLPGSICWIETKPVASGQGVMRWRVWVPAVRLVLLSSRRSRGLNPKFLCRPCHTILRAFTVSSDPAGAPVAPVMRICISGAIAPAAVLYLISNCDGVAP